MKRLLHSAPRVSLLALFIAGCGASGDPGSSGAVSSPDTGDVSLPSDASGGSLPSDASGEDDSVGVGMADVATSDPEPTPEIQVCTTAQPAPPLEGEWPTFELGPCELPETLPEDSLLTVDSAKTLRDPINDLNTQAFVSHIIDLDVDVDTGMVYVAALPGFFAFGPSDEGFRHLGVHPPMATMAALAWQANNEALHGDVIEFAHVEILGDGLVATTARGNPAPEFMFGPDHPGIYGLFILDVTDPSQMVVVAELLIPDLAGMFLDGPYLYTLSYMGELLTVDVTDPLAPEVVASMPGMVTPWEITVVGDRAYIADSSVGLTVVDISDPLAPELVITIPTASGLQDIAYSDGHLYGAAGAAGIEIFTLEDPDLPQCLTVQSTGPSAVGVDADAGLLWATNHEGVVLFDVSDPSDPRPLAVEDTSGWALHVHAHGNTAYIADWEYIHRVEYNPEAAAPETDIHPESLYFWDEKTTREFHVRNRGGADLHISGMESPDPRVTFVMDRDVVAPGEQATVAVTFVDDEEPLDTEICLATNDPDEPMHSVVVARSNPYGESPLTKFYHDGEGESTITIGEQAPDFMLADLDNNYHQLSEQIGRPVFLMFFSTW